MGQKPLSFNVKIKQIHFSKGIMAAQVSSWKDCGLTGGENRICVMSLIDTALSRVGTQAKEILGA